MPHRSTIERGGKLGQTWPRKGASMTSKLLTFLAAPVLAAALAGGPAMAADTYLANLGPMPLDQANNKDKLGRGERSEEHTSELQSH